MIRKRWWLILPAVYVTGVSVVTSLATPPTGIGLRGTARAASDVQWLVDDSWIDPHGKRQLDQQIFDAMLSMIDTADEVILADLFLFNDWQGPVRETHRALSRELTDALVARKSAVPSLSVILISDPINTVYGGLPSPHLQRMRAAGIQVVLTDLTRLQDSNPLYSGLWRWLIRPFGNTPGGHLPNPFGEGKVTLRSYLDLANFKANHRKLLIADDGKGVLQALVTSANPHDGSSAHRNTALRFSGAVVLDLLRSERRVLSMSGAADALQDWPARWRTAAASKPGSGSGSKSPVAGSTLTLLTESGIKASTLQLLEQAGQGDTVDLSMFYLADREIVTALIRAHHRKADVRVLLDVNSDAFGRQKNGVPNLPVAAELVSNEVPVRWCATRGEQCHAKQLHVVLGHRHYLQLGSGNFTRRNLDDFNLETDVLLQANARHPAIDTATTHYDQLWNNTATRRYSADYESHADDSVWLTVQYRLLEASGISTF